MELKELTALEDLDLSVNSLSGVIPPELGNLVVLEYFDVSINTFSGRIPTEFGTLTALTYLNMPFNRFSGDIPSKLSGLTLLKSMDLSHNDLSGSIPSELSALAALTNVDLSFNSLSGIIPSELSVLKGLDSLLLNQNRLTSFIPSEIGILTTLTYLDLSLNDLSGIIPSELSALSRLASLYLGANRLTGFIPSELSALTALRYLYLNVNSLSGPIPSEFSVLITIKELSLSGNRLTSFIPSEISILTTLTFLDLSYNDLSGMIPSELSALSRLASLYLQFNRLTGFIPSEIGILTALQNLVVTSNRLSGPIPSVLGSMTGLGFLDISGNKLNGKANNVFWNAPNMSLVNVDISDNLFSGHIPSGIFLLPRVESIAMTLNCFSGSLPSTLCEASSVSVFSMDGLGAARGCKNQISVPFTGLILGNKLTGSIPACVWDLPSIAVLSLSGNGLTGTLGRLSSHSSMVNLSVAHNHLEGTIPEEIQSFPFQHLDLSYNKLSGTCDSFTGTPSVSDSGTRSQVQVILAVNRLSGSLHHSLQWRGTLDVLTGNLFGCGSLPSNDKNANTYTCGSQELDQAVLVLLSIAGCCCLSIVFIACLWFFGIIEWADKAWAKSQLWLSSTTMNYLDATNPLITFNEHLRGGVKLSLLLMVLGIISCSLLYALKFVEDGKGGTAYSTHSTQYRWLYTAAYVTGQLPAGLLLGGWASCVSVVVCWKWRHHGVAAITNSSLSEKKPVRPINRVAIFSIILCNIGVVGVVNALYIFSLIKNLSQTTHNGIQIGLTVFKLLWSYGTMSGILLRPVRHSPHATWLTLVVCLMNSMLIPCMVAAFASPSCYEVDGTV
jgi:Leucine-rich repeat (LRR) protein